MTLTSDVESDYLILFPMADYQCIHVQIKSTNQCFCTMTLKARSQFVPHIRYVFVHIKTTLARSKAEMWSFKFFYNFRKICLAIVLLYVTNNEL